jgi:RsiW-degrading membrane proteinase PrsW (M82 family)
VDIVAALAPVVAFLAILVLLDSFKLVAPRLVCLAIGAGVSAALLCLAAQAALVAAGLPLPLLARYVAPLMEETAKAAFVLFLVRRARVGFLVDAAIVGFAVGTGFALAENVEYLRRLAGEGLALWIVRGFGTAMLHGGTTAVFAILLKRASDRAPRHVLRAALPGWAAAFVVHSAYNHLLLPPLAATGLLMLVLPVLLQLVFAQSEKATREWVGAGLDLDVELLNLLLSSHFSATRLGRYLRELKSHFPGAVVADMFCLLRLEIELGIRAKGMLMAREAGLDAPVDDKLLAQLRELEYLRRSIGRTGLIALRPLQMTSHRDQWHRYLLEQAAATRRRRAGL